MFVELRLQRKMIVAMGKFSNPLRDYLPGKKEKKNAFSNINDAHINYMKH